MKVKLVLENGREFYGQGFGLVNGQIGELFFSTSMVGYQDLLSDPAYFGKIACMTYPLIGNYGLTDDDYDFRGIHIRGYVVRENNDSPSNFRSTRIFSEAMEENKVAGISGIDTREITKIIRDEGMMKAMIVDADKSLEECLEILKNYQEEDALAHVSCKRVWYSRTANPSHTIVIIDLGVKTTLVKKFNEYGLNVIVVPYTTSVDEIKKLKPNGIVISNGPSNPNDLNGLVELINTLKGKYPLLGLGLGAQLIALSYGATITKMKHGHNGSNMPVRNIATDKVEITSQNHFYDIELTNNDVKITHVNVVDNSIEGFVDENKRIIAIQYAIQETLNKGEDVIDNFISSMKR